MSLIPRSRNSRTIWCLFWSAQLGCRTRQYFSVVTWTVVYVLQGSSLDPANMQRNFLENWRGTKASIYQTPVPHKRKFILKWWWIISAQPPLKNKDGNRVKHYWHTRLEHSAIKHVFKLLNANSKPCTLGIQVLATNTTEMLIKCTPCRRHTHNLLVLYWKVPLFC